MRKHEEALQILIHELEDFVGAETYCVTNGQSTGVVPDIVAEQTPAVTPPRASSLNQITKPSKKKKKKSRREAITLTEEQSMQQLSERRQLFSMLLRTYLAIKEKYAKHTPLWNIFIDLNVLFL